MDSRLAAETGIEKGSSGRGLLAGGFGGQVCDNRRTGADAGGDIAARGDGDGPGPASSAKGRSAGKPASGPAPWRRADGVTCSMGVSAGTKGPRVCESMTTIRQTGS